MRLNGHICIQLDIAETPRVVFIAVQNDKFSAAVRTCSVTDCCQTEQTVRHYGSAECETSLSKLTSVFLALDIQLMPATKDDVENV